ncbi:MAG: preprotein translocase subunit YajC [Clostridia bacterium]|nr:preprotein translocase subunit YajC [Clostridia bacterium]
MINALLAMITALLDDDDSSSSFWSSYGILIIMIIVIVIIIVLWWFSSRKKKKQEKEAQAILGNVKPGNKVKTIGGVCGIVVEVDEDENTFVLETGSEISGKCYMKFDRQAIYQTDAVAPPKPEGEEDDGNKKKKGKKDGEAASAASDAAADTVEAPLESSPAEESAPAASEDPFSGDGENK